MSRPPSSPQPPPGPAAVPAGEWRLALLLTTAAAVALPFLVARFPPIADLPQQAAQIRLLLEALADPGGLYRVQWLTPYSLSYAVIGGAWAVAGPLLAGRLAMLGIGLGWVAAIHWLARRRQRSAAAAACASLLFFNHTVYWGFYSFAVGFPVFVGWLALTLRPAPPERPVRAEAVWFLAGAAALYLSHALWLAAGGLWLVVHWAAVDRRWRTLAVRLAGMAPVLGLAAWWFAGLRGTTFATPPLWVDPPWRRLAPTHLVEAAFGGLRGRVEELAFALLLAWILAALLAGRRRPGGLRAVVDRPLLLAAAMFVLLALALPDKYTNTIQFDDRWMPMAMIFLLLALPPPRLPARLLAALALVLTIGFSAVTATVWRRFDDGEMSGMAEALAALPETPRVLGIDLLRQSRWVEGTPFLQGFAYAQVLRGGRLNFSFAEFAPSLVVFRRQGHPPWTAGLEWFPQLLKRRDLDHFDYLLVHATPTDHRGFAGDPRLATLTADGLWRLYRVAPPADSGLSRSFSPGP